MIQNFIFWVIEYFVKKGEGFYTPVKILTGRIMVYKCPVSVCLSVRLSGVNMSHRNLRTTYPNFMKLNIVVSYDGQMICILFGENKI